MPSTAISVAMPVYNGQEFIAAAIESVLAQTYSDFELIISDNASEDETESICKRYRQLDARVSYQRNSENLGAAKNYRIAFERCSHEYFRWHNADDLIHPELHARCLSALEAMPDAVLAAGTTMLIDADDQPIEAYDDNLSLQQNSPALRLQAFVQQVGLTNVIYGLMRRSAVAKTPIFGDGSLPAADTQFMGLLCLQGKFVQLPECLFYRRMHDHSFTAQAAKGVEENSFWSAREQKFELATWHRHRNYWQAAKRLECSPSERRELKRFLCRYFIADRPTLLDDLIGRGAW